MSTVPLSPLSPLRPLGHIETMMSLLHAHGGGTTQGLQALRLEGPVDVPGLRRAACQVLARHQALRCVIVQKDGAWWFATDARHPAAASSLPFTAVQMPEAQWAELIDHALHDAIDASQGLWRLTIASDAGLGAHLLLFEYHHAILDGDGVHALLNELLEAWAQERPDAIGADTGLCAAVDGFLPHTDEVPPGSGAAPIAHAKETPLAARRTRYLRSRMPSEAFEALQRRCEEDGVTVNALLSVCLARAAVAAGFAAETVDFRSAVSLRECMPQDMARPQALGCQLAVAQTDIQVSGGPLAEAARLHQRALMKAVMSQCLKARTFEPSLLQERVGAFVNGARFQGLGITNLGVIPLRTQWGRMAISDYLPLANRIAGHHAFALHVAIFNDALTWAFVYPAPVMDPAVLARIADEFATRLHAYTEGAQP